MVVCQADEEDGPEQSRPSPETCVCVFVRACVRASARACVYVCVCVCVCVCV